MVCGRGAVCRRAEQLMTSRGQEPELDKEKRRRLFGPDKRKMVCGRGAVCRRAEQLMTSRGQEPELDKEKRRR
ncbi:hypothetical protein, partial [Cytobacillus firmus]|uniref:hypothetical protein n=1 Tax=Cytobacillus firmus TaxID=1399 RepID=UPI002494836F